MYGGAVTLARTALAGPRPDLLLASDLLDLTTFLALTRRHLSGVPVAMYFHENQLTYPWAPGDSDPVQGRDRHYAWMNYTSALAADAVFFNSDFHRQAFLAALPAFLRAFPDRRGLDTVEAIARKSSVLPLGLDLRRLDLPEPPPRQGPPVLLWNHRWEYDKNPEAFFRLCYRLAEIGHDFRLIVLGESYGEAPAVFAEAREVLSGHILHWGYAEGQADYARLLHQADLLPVTSRQDFFGGSVVEALYCNAYPLLPDRLAYPEHVPAEVRHRHFYTTEEQLYTMTLTALDNVAAVRAFTGRAWVDKYDWQRLAPVYDTAMEDVSRVAR